LTILLFSCSKQKEINTFYFIDNLENAESISCKFIEEISESNFFIYPESIIDVEQFQGKKCLYHESWESKASLIDLGRAPEFSLSFKMLISSDFPEIFTIDPLHSTESGIFLLGSSEKNHCVTVSLATKNPWDKEKSGKILKISHIVGGDKYILHQIDIDFMLDDWIQLTAEFKENILYFSVSQKTVRIPIDKRLIEATDHHFGFFQYNAKSYLSNISFNNQVIDLDAIKNNVYISNIVTLKKKGIDFSFENKSLRNYAAKLKINNIYRNCLMGITPSRYQFPIELPEVPVLEFGYGIDKRGWHNANPVTFQIYINEEGQNPEKVFDKTLNPAEKIEHRDWIYTSIDINKYINKKVTISFVTYNADEIGNVNIPLTKANFGLWANPRIVNKIQTKQKKPNIILISLDLLNPAHLGFFGYEKYGVKISPFLDNFLSKSIVFKNAVAQSNMTVPSHMTLFTSFYPIIHDTYTLWARIDPSFTTLAEIMRDNGYNTCAVTGGSTMSGDHGFYKGFNEYYDNYHETFKHFDVDLTETEYSANKALEWLEKNKTNPFFLFLHTFELHAPYIHEDLLAEDLKKLDKNSLSEIDQRRRRVQTYDSGIYVLDREIGKFINRVEEMGLLDNTVVIFMSDHGEDFYYHENMLGDLSIEHSHSLYEEAIKVLLAFYCPERFEGGIIKKDQTGLIDIFPTILDMAGMDIPEQLQGESFLPSLLSNKEIKNKFRFSENFGRESPRYKDIQVAVRSNRYKYIYTKELEKMKEHIPAFPDITKELYDLENDPGEKTNLADKERELSRFFQTMIDEFLKSPKELESVYKKSTQIKLNPEAMRKLKSLGYIK